MGALDSRGLRWVAVSCFTFSAAALVAVASPMSCAFPDYTAGPPTGAGASGSTATTTSQGSMTTASTMSSTTTTTTTTTSTTTSGGGASTSTSTSTGPGGSTSTSSTASSSGSCTSMDCSNANCTSYACVPPVPSGWTGPFELFEGTKAPASCGADYPTQAYAGTAGIQVPQAVCNCTCNPATGQTCTLDGNPDSVTPGTVDAILVTDAPCSSTSFFCALPLETPSGWNWACYGTDGAPPNMNT
jgi:hypothetical protein